MHMIRNMFEEFLSAKVGNEFQRATMRTRKLAWVQ
jgi:hypothetical protein